MAAPAVAMGDSQQQLMQSLQFPPRDHVAPKSYERYGEILICRYQCSYMLIYMCVYIYYIPKYIIGIAFSIRPKGASPGWLVLDMPETWLLCCAHRHSREISGIRLAGRYGY